MRDPMWRFGWLTAGVVVLALTLSACGPGGSGASSAAPTGAPAGTSAAAAKPSAVASTAPSVGPSPAASAVPSPAASPSAVAAGGPRPTVRIGSTNFSEQFILGELYGQVLEANGFTVERRFNLGTREIVEPALESGQIDLYAEYVAHMLAFVDKNSPGSSDPSEATRLLAAALAPRGVTTLHYSPAADTNGLVVTRETADKYHLTRESDLQPVASQLVLGGPPECPERPFCISGFQRVYGMTFKDFRSLDAGGPLTIQALLGNQVDVAVLFTTDANIALNNLVLLDDDKHLQLADNVVPVVRTDVVTRAPDIPTLLDPVSAQMTTAELTDLNKQVGNDHKDAKDVAREWLKSKGLVR